jgi:phosphoribosylformylglycinamidine cyclo-ligase
VGYRLDALLPQPPVFGLVAERAGVDAPELYEVFNMGCGFCCVVPPEDAAAAVELLGRRHPGTGVIGRATAEAGLVEIPGAGIAGRREGGFARA